MRAGLIMTLVLALFLVSCGGDTTASTTTTRAPGTTGASSTTTGESSSTTGEASTTTVPLGQEGWARVPHDDAVFGVADPSWMWAMMFGATAFGPGVVAVGDRFPSVDYGDRPGVWTSADGAAWAVSPHDEAILGGAFSVFMEAVASGPGGLVAVGSTYQGEDNDAVVFASADGITWQRAAGADGAFGGPGWQGMHAVTAGGPGWVAVGYAASGEDWAAAVWTSADGLTWERVSHDEALFGGENDQEMFGVIAAGPGLVAVGVDDDAPAVWLSADGLAWEKVAADGFSSDPAFASTDKVMRAVAVSPQFGLVAVGYLEWYSEASDSEETDAVVWVSQDGRSWVLVSEDAATFAGPADQRMMAVTPGGPGFVAAGLDRAGGDGDAAVWTSSDGTSWRRIRNDAVFGGAGDQEMYGVVVAVSRLIAVGRDGAGAAVWVSPPPG